MLHLLLISSSSLKNSSSFLVSGKKWPYEFTVVFWKIPFSPYPIERAQLLPRWEPPIWAEVVLEFHWALFCSFPLSRSCVTEHWHFLICSCILSQFYAHSLHHCMQSLQSLQPWAQGWGSTHGIIWMQSEPQHGPWSEFPHLLTARIGCRTKIWWFCAYCAQTGTADAALSWGKRGSPQGASAAVPKCFNIPLSWQWALDSSRKQQPKGWSVQTGR